MALPEPLTPAGLDLRDFDWMPLQVVRLRDSGIVIVASAEAFRAAVLLWCAAWHQVPAASLPKDEKMLCSLAGFGRDLKTWRSLSSDALHGFVECSDGRLYHPVIAEKAIESGSKKRKQGAQTAAATEAARLARIARDAERNGDRDDERNGLQGRGPDRTGPDMNRPEEKSREGERAPAKVAPQGLGSQVHSAFIPLPEAIERCHEQGATDDEIDGEVRKFIAHHQIKQTFSPNWDASWAKWWENWKPHKNKHTKAKTPASSNAPIDWDSVLTDFKKFGRWSKWAGPDLDSPACRAPAEMLAKYGLSIVSAAISAPPARRMDA